MATTKEFHDYVNQELYYLGDVLCRPMMGEYLLYLNGKLFGGIYDNRLLIKPTKIGSELLEEPTLEIPYKGAKPRFLIENLDDKNFY